MTFYTFPFTQVVDTINTIALRLFVMVCVQTHQSVNFHNILCQLSVRKTPTAWTIFLRNIV
jgi:hypothetical protein